ncbi:homoserine kinase [Caloramator sp. Dgby_cultured_2]|uniref:homoserine kinase n=1 Tax=Caloramator sp. Dgby_cultured_2 TaxID=3029174 RepID=UPI00237EE933|nr:homoserine kinase [Caloramator sp. Dgby_cultured_2]WDU83001.1 homoserine kinase [Caloramator sp. Dgby_cultured_2]
MVKVRVPATTANIGPGFGCLGIALDLYCYIEVEEIEKGLVIEGCDDKFKGEDNLIYKSMKRIFESASYSPRGIKIKVDSKIPISRGLGSSAACIIGGLLAANELVGRVYSKEEILNIATQIEGHPDNVTPALVGGMTAAIYERDRVYYNKIKVADRFKFYALIPQFTVSTEKARKVLPKVIDYKDAVFNIGRVSLLITSFIEGNDNIKIACRDKIHEDYRKELIRGFDTIKEKCLDLGSLAVFISGSGSTLMAVVDKENTDFKAKIEKDIYNFEGSWIVKEVNIDYEGAKIIK